MEINASLSLITSFLKCYRETNRSKRTKITIYHTAYIETLFSRRDTDRAKFLVRSKHEAIPCAVAKKRWLRDVIGIY